MMARDANIGEQSAQAAFNKQAPIFDALYSRDTIIQYKRERVRSVVDDLLAPYSRILELNAGTGEDAIYFAGQGHAVHATDISGEMLDQMAEKVRKNSLDHLVSQEQCSYTQLDQLQVSGQFDLIFSNFAGLNCTDRLDAVLSSFPRLVKPGGIVTLVILPRFCLWEFLLLFRGKVRTALRRFAGRKGAKAHMEGEYFRCWYYNPSYVRKRLSESFDLVSLEGLCTLVPPSYMEGFAEKHPGLYQRLVKLENAWKHRWPWNVIGDYYIITLRRKAR